MIAFGIAAIAAVHAPQALAWHDDGHRIVGEIAERNLSPATRAKVRALLQGSDGKGDGSLATASIWADHEARESPEFAFAASSHYVNLDGPTSPRELHAQCLERAGCLATAIPYYADILRSEGASEDQRAEALRFLVHFVGDAHQPLHAGRRGDRGGNDIDRLTVPGYTAKGETTNLHAAWDGALVALALTERGVDWKAYAVELDAGIDAEARARWVGGTIYDWLEESRRFAAAEAYLHVDGLTPVRSGDTLDADWYRRNSSTAEQRLSQAGVRLAALLEAILEDA